MTTQLHDHPTASSSHRPAGRLGAVLAPIQALRRRPGTLPVLEEMHPEARLATRMPIGVREIPVEAIAGTAVGGPRLRRADFRPIPAAQSAGWQSRWQRLQRAFDRLVPLPPIEVLEVGGEYWVLDGHNRVAIARQRDLAYLDAEVLRLTWPGGPSSSWSGIDRRAALQAGRLQRAAASASGGASILSTLGVERIAKQSMAICCD